MNIESLVMNTFMFIGMVVCIVVTAIALVWVTCFVVRMLVKSFGAKVSSYCDIMVDDIKTKSAHKKELKHKKRLVEKQQKEEFLKIKLINKKRRNDIKKKNLSIKLRNQQNDYSMKVLGVPLDDVEFNDPQEEIPDNGMALINELFPTTKLPTEPVAIDPVEEEVSEIETIEEGEVFGEETPVLETEENAESLETEEVSEFSEEIVENPETNEVPEMSYDAEFVAVEGINEEVAPVEEVVEETPIQVEETPVQEVPVHTPKKRGRKPKNR